MASIRHGKWAWPVGRGRRAQCQELFLGCRGSWSSGIGGGEMGTLSWELEHCFCRLPGAEEGNWSRPQQKGLGPPPDKPVPEDRVFP